MELVIVPLMLRSPGCRRHVDCSVAIPTAKIFLFLKASCLSVPTSWYNRRFLRLASRGKVRPLVCEGIPIDSLSGAASLLDAEQIPLILARRQCNYGVGDEALPFKDCTRNFSRVVENTSAAILTASLWETS
ncbi:hypothetical protein GQ53DRAFT_767870 [Thozetella sp. PMI_491]|nr:hypothetical protein GQ53DRAFT_767870 [Thozetella sp. PMI_491]